jgi:hypothetical protein
MGRVPFLGAIAPGSDGVGLAIGTARRSGDRTGTPRCPRIRCSSCPPSGGTRMRRRRRPRQSRFRSRIRNRSEADRIPIVTSSSWRHVRHPGSSLRCRSPTGTPGPGPRETNVTGDASVMTGKIALTHLRELPAHDTWLARIGAEAEGGGPGLRGRAAADPQDRAGPARIAVRRHRGTFAGDPDQALAGGMLPLWRNRFAGSCARLSRRRRSNDAGSNAAATRCAVWSSSA